VFDSVRKLVDVDRLSSEFGASVTQLMFDVTDETAVLAAAREVRARRWAARRSVASSTMPALR
jgi:4-hydroxyphenylpyruvate dioxygenase-like putative hemolysin